MGVVLMVAMSACGSPESRAEDDARDLVRDRLGVIEADLSASLPGFDPIADASALGSWVPGTYRHAVEGDRMVLEFGVRAVGRDGLSVGDTTIAGGACFRVVGTTSGGTITQVTCPRSFLREPGRPVDTEVEVIDSVRPLEAGESRLSYPPSAG